MPTPTLAAEAAKRLTDWLAAAKVKEGDRLPSERSLARTLGVSLYALNRAMGRCIAEGRVERQGYKNFVADAAFSPARLTCHLVVSRRSEYLSNYRRAARDFQMDLKVHTYESTEEAAAILGQLDREGVDGVICDPPSDPNQLSWVTAARQLVRRRIPVVSIIWASNELSSISANVTHGIELGMDHLFELGHRELALVTVGDGAVEDCWRRGCMAKKLGGSAKRIRQDPSWLINRKDVEALAALLAGDWRDVTGLVIRVCHTSALQVLLTELARNGRRVPEMLSVFAVGNALILNTVQPRITSACIDMGLWIETAFSLLQREMRSRGRLGVLPPPSILHVIPRLNLRDSTAARGGIVSVPANDRIPVPIKPGGVETSGELDQRVRSPYSLAAKASLSERPRFEPVNLKPFANRPLHFRRGWLGDLPLLGLPPGRREIHGVPFEVLGGSSRSHMGAVVFHSSVNRKGNGHELPDRLRIPIGSRAEAIYILHGCGYARPLQPFARYTVHGAKGPLGVVPLVSLGKAQGDASPADRAAPKANIQDWWSDFPHENFPHARMVPLLDDEDSLIKRHVFLYTLEWINPFPGRLVTHLEITADPAVPTTLGLLAVTVVKPRKA